MFDCRNIFVQLFNHIPRIEKDFVKLFYEILYNLLTITKTNNNQITSKL